MEKRGVIALFGLLMVLLLAGCGGNLPSDDPWVEDIEQLRDFVTETHPKFTEEALSDIPRNMERRTAFHAALDALLADLPDLEDAEIIQGIQRAVAAVGDNHFNLLLAEFEMEEEISVYPLGFRWLSGGVYLLTTEAEFAHVLNQRLIGVGGREIDDVFAEFQSFWAVENIYNAKNVFARLLNNPAFFEALSLEANFAFEEDEIALNASSRVYMDVDDALFFPFFSVDNRMDGDLPFFVNPRGQGMEGRNWFYFMEADALLYIRLELYVQELDLETGIFTDFVGDVMDIFEAHTPRAVVIDARQNAGGDNAYLAELFEFLAQYTPEGMLFHFIDEGSASAALLGAAHLKSLGAVLLGQPTGQNTEFYGFHVHAHAGFHEGMYFGDLDWLEGMDLDEEINMGVATDEYPYYDVVTMTVREFLEQQELEAESEGAGNTLQLNHSGLYIAVPNLFLSASDMFGLDLEFYTLRPHIQIAYTIEDWIYNRDPVLEYVLRLIR